MHFACVGLALMIEDAHYSRANVKVILSKKRPLTMVAFHEMIADLYQTKLCQDMVEKNSDSRDLFNTKPRLEFRHDSKGGLHGGFSQMLLDVYTVYYGLKELAIGQLVHLDATIRKYAAVGYATIWMRV